MIPSYWNTVITLYSRVVDHTGGTDKVSYIPHVLNNCFFKKSTKQHFAGQSVNNTTQHIVRIPYVDGLVIKKSDFIVKGLTSESIEDVKGKRLSDMKLKYGSDCFIVNAVHDNTGFETANHWLASDFGD